MVGFRRAKRLKDILVREKVAPLADYAVVLGANMLRLLNHSDLSVPKENIALSLVA